MVESILRRDLAPVTREAWQQIEQDATRALQTYCSARTVVDFSGPHGWALGAVNLGRLDMNHSPEMGGAVRWGLRKVLPLIEYRVTFVLNQWEMDNASRGAEDIDTDPAIEAAKKAALFEDGVVYAGMAEAGIAGILPSSPHEAIGLGSDPAVFPHAVAEAVEVLHREGINGPYALVLDPDRYHQLAESTQTGYPLYRVIERIVEGGVKWSPALDGGVVLSLRDGDFRLTVGQDMSIGYSHHTADELHLYFTETFTFQVLEPAAAVVLKP